MFLELEDKEKRKSILIEYNITRKRVKNINIRIDKDNKIEVSASRFVSNTEIEKVLKEKRDWILSVLKKNETRNDYKLAKEIGNDCNSYFLFGNEYKLNFINDNDEFDTVFAQKSSEYIEVLNEYENIKICFKTLNIYINNSNKKWKKEFINFETNIFIKEIRVLLNDSLKKLSSYNLDIKNIKLKTLKSCWGICHTVKNEITLNRKLVNYDKECLRYVIVHELSHLVHANHSKEFYEVVEIAVPNYKKIRKFLNES